MRVPKATGTHSDVLAAVGLADLLASAGNTMNVRLVEHETEFKVLLDRPLDAAIAQTIPQAPGYPFLKTNEETSVPTGIADVVNYKEEKAKADRTKEAANAKGKKGAKALDTETQQFIEQETIRDDWRLLQVLNTLQGDETANKVHTAVMTLTREKFRNAVASSLANVIAGRPSGLTWNVNTVQLFTPTSAKGYSRLKPDSTDRNDKTKQKWTDPFWEWMKYRGYFRVACPYFQGQKGEHVRLLCPVPKDISVQALELVSRELRKRGIRGGAPKMDALAALRCAELLIRHSQEYHALDAEPFPGLQLSGKTPEAAISGVLITHYQSLGNAKAVSAMTTIAVPGWFRIQSGMDAQDWLAILDEHQRVIRGLYDDRSDEIALLIAYRRFLEKRGESALWALVQFMERYGAFVMKANGLKQGNRIRWVTRFTDQYFRRIVMGMNNQLMDIVKNPGFEAIARAVRQATVTAQNKRARRDKDAWREVRYELLHDIHRTRQVPGNAFVECVSEFISRYNYENARRREVTKDIQAAPANVSDEEFKSFIGVVDRHGASVVGALLAAYGSCKEKWEDNQNNGDNEEEK
jgi:hypothetical protein